MAILQEGLETANDFLCGLQNRRNRYVGLYVYRPAPQLLEECTTVGTVAQSVHFPLSLLPRHLSRAPYATLLRPECVILERRNEADGTILAAFSLQRKHFG